MSKCLVGIYINNKNTLEDFCNISYVNQIIEQYSMDFVCDLYNKSFFIVQNKEILKDFSKRCLEKNIELYLSYVELNNLEQETRLEELKTLDDLKENIQTLNDKINKKISKKEFNLKSKKFGIEKVQNENDFNLNVEGFAKNMDELGLKKDTRSYISVINIKLKRDLENNIKSLQNNELENSLNNLVQEIKDNESLLNDKSFEFKKDTTPIMVLNKNQEELLLLTDARLSFEFSNMLIKDIDDVCICGISIIHKNFNLQKAIDLSYELVNNNINKNSSVIDYHFSQGEILNSIEKIRENIKVDKSINLHIKPLYINEGNYTYENFKNELLKLKESDKSSKVRELREVFPKGIEKSRLFINKYKLNSLFDGKYIDKTCEYGFVGNTCLYFDIIEASKLFRKWEEN